MASEWKKPILWLFQLKMRISNWRFWQSVAISWKNLQFIVKILKVSGWVFFLLCQRCNFPRRSLTVDWQCRWQALVFEFCEICTLASIFVARAVKKQSKAISMPDLVCVFRLCHLSAFPNRSKAVLNGSNLLYLSFYSDDIYNYEVCISLFKAYKMISQKDRLCFFMHDVTFDMVKSHVNNGVLCLQ